MKSKASRWTKQLQAIMDIVYNNEFNLTADEVYAEARKKIPNISLGTVYRNLNKLVQRGYIASVQKGQVQTFSKHPFTNAHFECVMCKRILRVPFDLRTTDLSKKVGMEVTNFELRMTGICRECESKCI
jgi:Fur family transcriptional regulator, peroxide stress response regulator